MKETARLSQPMRNVIKWLLHYPKVRIMWTRGPERPRFNMYWASEAARLHMIGTCEVLKDFLGDMETGKSEPRWGKPLDGTPRLTRQTFRALRKRRLVRAVERRVPTRGMSDMYYYQLTAEGKQAASSLSLIRGKGNS